MYRFRRHLSILIVALIAAGLWGPDSLAVGQDSCVSEGAVPPTETALAADCEVLLDVRDTLAGTATLDWAADVPIEEWEGVKLDETPTRVTVVSLPERGLSGTIPGELGELSKLTGLSLWSNQLTGTIPRELGNLSNLVWLYLSDNQLTGTIPRELGNLSNLVWLYLGDNELAGQIPTEFDNLSNLQSLVLWGNQLSGSVPSELAGLANLSELFLSFNRLSGTIPKELSYLSNLTYLGLGSNQLSGTIPPELSSLSNLTYLYLGSNQLSGTIPSELASLSNLTELYLYQNELSGTIPPELASLSNLTYLYLSYNQLSGTIPKELGDLYELTHLNLSGNQLSGTIPPELGQLTNLEWLELNENELTGKIPRSFTGMDSLTVFYFRDNAGLCAPTDDAFQAWLQGLEERGVHPCDFATDRAVLVRLYNATDGANWQDSSNWLSDLPMGEWYGVDTDTGGRVSRLDLYGNQLRGTIPPELGSLSNVMRLSLSENQLGGTIPTELGGLSNLERLSLGGNRLSGTIPPELGSLSNLTRLSLRENQLSGEIPHDFTNLTKTSDFYFSDNAGLCAPTDDAFQAWLQALANVEGHPCDSVADRDVLVTLYNATDGLRWRNRTNWLSNQPMREWHGVTTGDEGRITELHLGNNQLSGQIPTEVGQLASLQRLDLSENQLSGQIPRSLIYLTNLNRFYFSDNAGLCAPVNEAFQSWLQGIAAAEFGSCNPMADLNVLVRLYDTTDGTNWKDSSNWLTDLPMRKWHSVDTDDEGHITVLDLRRNGLSGSIPQELGGLSNLEELDLAENKLTGTIPTQLGSLANLTSLWLGENKLTGTIPPELGGLSNLQELDLVRNRLTGTIPTQLGSLAGLTSLWLGENRLTGTIPTQMGNLNNLAYLSLSHNELTGPIPPQLGNLTNLAGLYLYGNKLTGSIPLELVNLSSLEALYLHDNPLSGCIPPALQSVANNDLDRLGLPACVTPMVTMSIDSASYQVRLRTPVPVTVIFSEPVNQLIASDVTVDNGEVSSFVGSNGDSVYTFDVIPNAISVVTVDIPAGVSRDADGNGNAGSARLTLGLPYDDDHDGSIGRSEISAAVRDYLNGILTGKQIRELIRLYLRSGG